MSAVAFPMTLPENTLLGAALMLMSDPRLDSSERYRRLKRVGLALEFDADAVETIFAHAYALTHFRPRPREDDLAVDLAFLEHLDTLTDEELNDLVQPRAGTQAKEQ
jgi:hypothetical protein